jgi:hypothetical protein
MPIAAIFLQTEVDSIFPAALTRIPFASESVRSWNHESDIALFIKDICDVPLKGLYPDGSWRTGNSSKRAAESFAEGKEASLTYHENFVKSQTDSNAVAHRLSNKSASAVGLALKYLLAWRTLTDTLLSQSAFNSLPHILEADTDLECSLDLAISHYYKQAAQVLRSFLEEQVIDLLLAHNAKAFEDWKHGSFRVPSLRGKNGLLKLLESDRIIVSPLRARVDLAYDQLNSYVHGAETTLIHSGVFKGKHRGRVLDSKKLDIWSKQVTEVVEIGLWLMKEKTHIWSNNLQSQFTMCGICRENTLQEAGGFSFAGTNFLKFRCAACRNEETFSKDPRRRVYVVTVEYGPVQRDRQR